MKPMHLIMSLLENPGVSWVFAFVFIVYMHKMHKRQLNDRQKELDRLADDNHICRDRNERLLDRIENLLLGKTFKQGKKS
ncbi:MAG: hypothetical protein OD817_09075 [Gammaproteobacteria bacterium]